MRSLTRKVRITAQMATAAVADRLAGGRNRRERDWLSAVETGDEDEGAGVDALHGTFFGNRGPVPAPQTASSCNTCHLMEASAAAWGRGRVRAVYAL